MELGYFHNKSIVDNLSDLSRYAQTLFGAALTIARWLSLLVQQAQPTRGPFPNDWPSHSTHPIILWN